MKGRGGGEGQKKLKVRGNEEERGRREGGKRRNWDKERPGRRFSHMTCFGYLRPFICGLQILWITNCKMRVFSFGCHISVADLGF